MKAQLQTGLAGLGLQRASSHLPSKHWGSLLSFLWKRTWFQLQAIRAETGIQHSNFQICKGSSQTNLPGKTGLPRLGLWWSPLNSRNPEERIWASSTSGILMSLSSSEKLRCSSDHMHLYFLILYHTWNTISSWKKNILITLPVLSDP